MPARKTFFEHGASLKLLLPTSARFVAGGDLHSHFGRDSSIWGWTGPRTLATPTATDSHQLQSWAQTWSLQHVDSHLVLPRGTRGTWRNGFNKLWYENDFFLADVPAQAHRWRKLRSFPLGFGDHWGRAVSLMLLGGEGRGPGERCLPVGSRIQRGMCLIVRVLQ